MENCQICISASWLLKHHWWTTREQLMHWVEIKTSAFAKWSEKSKWSMMTGGDLRTLHSYSTFAEGSKIWLKQHEWNTVCHAPPGRLISTEQSSSLWRIMKRNLYQRQIVISVVFLVSFFLLILALVKNDRLHINTEITYEFQDIVRPNPKTQSSQVRKARGNPLDGCSAVYLDMGTNLGVQIRYLYWHSVV